MTGPSLSSSPSARTASAALDATRPIIARLDVARDGEDVAADLLEAWKGTETALRSLIGGSGLAGQALVRELRQRELLTLPQTHSLLEFLAARDRADSASYRPTSADVAAARDGFQQVEAALGSGMPLAGTPAPSGGYAGAGRSAYAAAPVAPGLDYLPGDSPASERGPGRTIAFVVGGALLVLLLVFLLTPLGRGLTGGDSGDRDVAAASALYARGDRAGAATAFDRIVREDPGNAMAHVYVGRLARERGEVDVARTSLERAIRLDGTNAIALREMGSYLLTVGNYDLARRFYVRALQRDPADRSSMGFLGCSLVRLGRAPEAQTWFSRAGQGAWSACAQGGAPGQGFPGGAPARL